MDRNGQVLTHNEPIAEVQINRHDMRDIDQVTYGLAYNLVIHSEEWQKTTDPEEREKLLEKKRSIVITVSEGIRTADGTYISELGNSASYVDAFGHKQLTGTARFLCNVISERIGCKTRAIELSSLQRAASH